MLQVQKRSHLLTQLQEINWEESLEVRGQTAGPLAWLDVSPGFLASAPTV